MKHFIEHFQDVIQTEEDVELLRKKILDLAVRGQLVEQDPNDEPASSIIKRNKNEKEKLIRAKKIRKIKPLPPINSEEIPFDIPKSWEWVRLDELSAPANNSFVDGPFGSNLKTSDYTPFGVRLIQLQNIKEGYWDDSNKKYISVEKANSLSRCLTYPGDIAIAKMAYPVARSCIVPALEKQYILVADCIKLTVFQQIQKEYVCNVLNSIFFKNQAENVSTGTTRKRISLGKLKKLLFPVPPINEQRRIVDKVDKLFTYCNLLASNIRQKKERSSYLNKNVFTRIKDSTNKEVDRDIRFTIEHMEDLLQTKEHVQLLRNSILSLATRGKLVEQDPNDEPASVFLKRIKEEKEQLIKEKKIRKTIEAQPIKAEEIPYKIPDNWEWVRLSQIVYVLGGSTPQKSRADFWNNGDILWVSPKDMKSMYIKDSIDKITSKALEQRPLALIPKESLLMVVRSGILKRTIPLALTQKKCTINQDIKSLNVPVKNVNKYLFWLLKGNESRILEECAKKGTTVDRIIFDDLMKMLFPIPPLKEQMRIINKIEELMNICDKLEQQITSTEYKSNLFMRSVLQKI
ncbi:restriction endonuclease subunit S [Alteribacillus sp. JSM 102045]|uniref:restriction endonuclease subunit S n=1 Tax=Alteribacillus sp. JSM 102045 TaxID=1562101 RepID=UPI0035C19DE7